MKSLFLPAKSLATSINQIHSKTTLTWKFRALERLCNFHFPRETRPLRLHFSVNIFGVNSWKHRWPHNLFLSIFQLYEELGRARRKVFRFKMHSERVVKLFSQVTDDRSDQKASWLVHCASWSEKLLFWPYLLLLVIGIDRKRLWGRRCFQELTPKILTEKCSLSGQWKLQSLSCALNFQVRLVS